MILVLQHVAHEPPGLITEVFDDWSLEYRIAELHKGDNLPDGPDSIEGLVIMGGPMSVSDEDRYPWLNPEKRLIRKTIEHHKPVLGICLGCQLLAEALGGEVYPGPKKEIGWLPVSWTHEARMHPFFAHFPDQQLVFQWHGDTFDLPMGALRLATADDVPNQGFAYGPRIVGLQFHLEVTESLIEEWFSLAENKDMLEALNEPLDKQREYTSIYLRHLNESCRPLVRHIFMG